MLIRGEWNMDEALAVRYEEGREDEREEHQQQMRELFVLLESGVPVAEAKRKMGLVESP